MGDLQLRVSSALQPYWLVRSIEGNERESKNGRIRMKKTQTAKKTKGRSGVFWSVTVTDPSSHLHVAVVSVCFTSRLSTTGDEGLAIPDRVSHSFLPVHTCPPCKSRPYVEEVLPTSAFGTGLGACKNPMRM